MFLQRLVASAVAAFALAGPNDPAFAVYLPRVLYPGSYRNYCGPSCSPHGRNRDEPVDAVDAACQAHDVAYCNCEKDWGSWRESRGLNADTRGLSALTAIRFASTLILEARGVDASYVACTEKPILNSLGTASASAGKNNRTDAVVVFRGFVITRTSRSIVSSRSTWSFTSAR